jgi:hypothetical protein
MTVGGQRVREGIGRGTKNFSARKFLKQHEGFAFLEVVAEEGMPL